MKKKFLKIYNEVIGYIVTNRLFLLYLLLSFLGIILFKINVLGKMSFLSLVTEIGVVLVLGSFCYFIKPKNQFKYLMTCLCIYSLAEIVNAIYYVFYTSFSSFSELASLSQAKTVTGSIFEKMRISYLIYICFPIFFYWIHSKLKNSPYYNYISKIENGVRMFTTTILVGLLFLGLSFAKATKTDYSRLAKQWNRTYIVERFGILFYEINDLYQSLIPKFSSIFGYEDAKLIFEDYFASDNYNKYRNSSNKYTGILEGKNIVFVHMEGIENFTMNLKFNNQEVTPNLNKLSKDGLFFENYYPEVSTGTSSDSEFSILSSLMPAASGTVFVGYYKNNYVTIPKLLADKGYTTFSSHGNAASMWNRLKAHPSLGYQNMYFEESFEYTEDDVINLGINDIKFFEQLVPIMENVEQNNKNYMGTVITLSNHSPFIYLDKYGEFDMSTTYIDEVTGEEVTTDYLKGTAVGNYLQSVHYADSALGVFMDLINSSDYFNDTVFIFYGDHDVKLSTRQKNYLYNYDYKTGEVYTEEDKNYTQYNSFLHELNKKTPLIMWTKDSKLKKKLSGTVSYYMGAIDVAPTLLNMLNLKNEYALGHDIFSIKDNNTIPFPNGNYLTNVMYYNNSSGEYYVLNNNKVISEDYIDEHKKYVDELLSVSNSIIVYNLLNKER